jgi:outer membrane phospholipase A
VGPLEGEIKFIQLFDSMFDQLEAVININPGGKWSTEFEKGGYQLSLNFHVGGLKVVPAFYVQYYHGYAETLVNYDQSVDEFRAGLMF